MKSVAQLRSLGDIRTIVSTHTRSVPRSKGSNYLETLCLGMEKNRLETELAWLTKRQRRIDKRLEEIRSSMTGLASQTLQEQAPISSPVTSPTDGTQVPEGDGSNPHKWRQMTIGY